MCKLPEDSIFILGPNLAVCRPELCYQQVATQLSIVRCIQLGYELCGYYSYDSSEVNGFSQHQPLSSRELCLEFLHANQRIRGSKSLKTALGHVIDGSASPRESICAMLLTLPCRMGGYGLPKPKLNAKVELNEKARAACRRSAFTCDFFWPEYNVLLEYQSNMAHSQSRIIDANKRAALESSGFQVFELTSDILGDKPRMDEFAHCLAAALGGRRIRSEHIPDFEERKLALRNELFRTQF